MKNIENKIVTFIKDYVSKSGTNGVVIGMSGGKDSFVTAALCVQALSKKQVLGVIMPNGKMTDLEIAKRECDYLGIDHKTINIAKITENISKNTKNALHIKKLNEVSSTNIAPRVRMTTLYALAAELGFLVVNTSNLSESMIGYTTKWGDNVGDIAPLASLTKTEVCELGLSMGLPEEFINKPPADGLTGQTDEDIVGFSYTELDEFIRTGKVAKNHEKILKMNFNSRHKRSLPPSPDLNLKNYFIDK